MRTIEEAAASIMARPGAAPQMVPDGLNGRFQLPAEAPSVESTILLLIRRSHLLIVITNDWVFLGIKDDERASVDVLVIDGTRQGLAGGQQRLVRPRELALESRVTAPSRRVYFFVRLNAQASISW